MSENVRPLVNPILESHFRARARAGAVSKDISKTGLEV